MSAANRLENRLMLRAAREMQAMQLGELEDEQLGGFFKSVFKAVTGHVGNVVGLVKDVATLKIGDAVKRITTEIKTTAMPALQGFLAGGPAGAAAAVALSKIGQANAEIAQKNAQEAAYRDGAATISNDLVTRLGVSKSTPEGAALFAKYNERILSVIDNETALNTTIANIVGEQNAAAAQAVTPVVQNELAAKGIDASDIGGEISAFIQERFNEIKTGTVSAKGLITAGFIGGVLYLIFRRR